jgi:hypothetical protein
MFVSSLQGRTPMTTTSDPAAVPDVPGPDVCEVCGSTYGPSFGEGIYGPWLERHNRRPHDKAVPGASS